MPTKSFLFVDQVRSTEQLTSLGDQAAHAVRRGLFDLLRQATDVSGGHEVDFTGDGLFAAFDGAVEAVEAAVLMQQLCFSFNARQLVPARLGLRIGVHSGEPLVSEGGGYFGVAVVVASRLCSTAQEGQILVSDVVRSLVAPRGTHEFASVGELSLRGVPEPVTGYQVWWKPDTQPPRLPEPLAAMRSGAFVGRTAERQRIESAWQAVQAGGRRFVLVSGDRGMGSADYSPRSPNRRVSRVPRSGSAEPMIVPNGSLRGARQCWAGPRPRRGPSCAWPWARERATCYGSSRGWPTWCRVFRPRRR